jgi:hypothetical protein
MTDKHTSRPATRRRDNHAEQQYIDLTNAKLDEEHAFSEMLIQLREFSNAREFIPIEGYDYGPYGPTLPPSLEMALEAAKSGDITLLRRIYPEIVEYLQPPPGKRGRPAKPNAVREAVSDVRLIRDKIWKDKKLFGNRPRNITAEKIAADRHRGVKEEMVRNRLKKFKKKPL